MADYGLKPWDIERLTMEELKAILQHQNDRWEAIRVQNRQNRQMKQRQRRG